MAREFYFGVQVISTATAANENFAGEVHSYIFGTGEEWLFAETGSAWNDCNRLYPSYVREYGYKRRCDAVRNYEYKHPQNDRNWKTEVKIVRLWIRKDNQVFVEC